MSENANTSQFFIEQQISKLVCFNAEATTLAFFAIVRNQSITFVSCKDCSLLHFSTKYIKNETKENCYTFKIHSPYFFNILHIQLIKVFKLQDEFSLFNMQKSQRKLTFKEIRT